jgi:hypothetical protein
MTTEHLDKLGRTVQVDDFVAFPQANRLMIGKVRKLSDKILIISTVSKKRLRKWSGETINTYRKYSHDSVKIDTDCAGLTMYVIQNQ